MADQTLEIQAPNELADLDSLAKQIDAAHVAVQTAALTGAERAIEAGQLLIQAKKQVPYGQWETWVSKNTAVSPRMASSYQRVAQNWVELTNQADRKRVSDLSLRALLEELSEDVIVSSRVISCPPVEPRTTTRPRITEPLEELPTRTGLRVVERIEELPGPTGIPVSDDPADYQAATALRLIGGLDPSTLAKASQLGGFDLEELSDLLSEAAIIAAEL